eukprot:5573767-Prymnesium_polylepis.1
MASWDRCRGPEPRGRRHHRRLLGCMTHRWWGQKSTIVCVPGSFDSWQSLETGRSAWLRTSL